MRGRLRLAGRGGWLDRAQQGTFAVARTAATRCTAAELPPESAQQLRRGRQGAPGWAAGGIYATRHQPGLPPEWPTGLTAVAPPPLLDCYWDLNLWSSGAVHSEEQRGTGCAGTIAARVRLTATETFCDLKASCEVVT